MDETKKQWQMSIKEWRQNYEEERRQAQVDLQDSIMTCSREDSSLEKVFVSSIDNGIEEQMPVSLDNFVIFQIISFKNKLFFNRFGHPQLHHKMKMTFTWIILCAFFTRVRSCPSLNCRPFLYQRNTTRDFALK